MSNDYESRYAAVGDVRQLKLKRRARLGAITHHEHYLNTHNKIALSDDICPSEVQSKLEKVKVVVFGGHQDS